MMKDTQTKLIADAILFYLERYPASADTVEGICLWWIDSCALGTSLFGTQLALEQLEKKRKVERITLGDREIWRKPRKSINKSHH